MNKMNKKLFYDQNCNIDLFDSDPKKLSQKRSGLTAH